jgi:CubicO group peptidase (beta-lactamase class C family)
VAADAFSGVVLLARNGGVLYERAAGLADRERNVPLAVDTKLQIASMTKLFTSIAIRQLEQAGRLSPDDTVGTFLPNYRNAVVRSKVTLEMLLKHRSGVGSFWNARYMAHATEIRSVKDYMELFQSDSLLFEPGTSEAYSNGGYVILGAIIEKVSGQSYHDYLRDHVFKPAGMNNTVPQDLRSDYANSAVGYTRQPGGAPQGDTRLAGAGSRPGYGQAQAGAPQGGTPPAQSGGAAPAGMRLRLVGPDGKELTPEQAREAMARRASAPRRPNTEFKAGMSSPAGDHFSTVEDLLKLANALTSRKLLDSTRTAALIGPRWSSGQDFRANGGGPGVNAEFSIFPSGDVIVVLSNYDPPAATDVAEFIRGLIAAKPSR